MGTKVIWSDIWGQKIGRINKGVFYQVHYIVVLPKNVIFNKKKKSEIIRKKIRSLIHGSMMCYFEDMVSHNFCDVTGQNKKRLIEKLLGLKSPVFQSVFGSFLKNVSFKYHINGVIIREVSILSSDVTK